MKKKSYIVSLILIITVGITTLAVGWHEYFSASKKHKLISCDNHIDSNYDMACDLCGQNLPLSSNYIENKEVTIFAKDENLIKVNGLMPKNTFVSSDTIEKEEAFSLAKSYLKNLKEEDIILAYDISLDYNGQKYQPAEFNHFVDVSIIGADLNKKEKISLLHIIDDEKYEILPVNKISDEEILFNATRFSTYILLDSQEETSGTITKPETPENFIASSGEYEDEIVISWNMVSNTKYRLSYINDENARKILSEEATSPFSHTGLEKNKSYEYILEAYDENMVYSTAISIKGFTEYDDIFDKVNKDTVKPIIDNITITPNEGNIGPLTDIVITFNVTDTNYDYLNGCNLFKDDIEVLINNVVTTNLEKELTKEVIASGEKYILTLKKIVGDGALSLRIPSGKILDFAKNGNDEYIINTNVTIVRTEVAKVTNFVATSGDYEDKIKLTWEDKNNQNVTYVIEASNQNNNWIVLSSDAPMPYYHEGLTKNVSFEYRIKAVKENGDESAYVYATGKTEYDPLSGDVMVDTVKPTISLVSKTPDVVYLGKTQEITFVFESFDENYNTNTTELDKDGFIIKVDGTAIDDVSRTLTKENITSGERFTLTLTNITGNGDLKIVVPEKVITDCALNQNEETEIETQITVVNDSTTTDTAPTLDPRTHEIKVITNQLAGSVPIESITYEYRVSGDKEFKTWKTKSSGDEEFRNELVEKLSSDTYYEIRTIVTDVANNVIVSQSAFAKTLKIDASKITITHTPTEWTNKDVTAVIDWSGDETYYHEYSLDNKNWTRVATAKTEVIFSQNGILYARYSDGVGHSDPIIEKIENIDKIKPVIGKVEVPEGKANSKTIKVSEIKDEGGSGLKGYYINSEANLENATWTTLEKDNFEFTVTENGPYIIWVIDNAGNISEAYSSNIVDIQDKVTNIDFNSGEALELDVFETKKPELKYDGTPKSITYEIENKEVADVSGDTGAVTGKKEGTTILKVIIEDFDGTKYEKEIEVKVNAIEPTLIIDKSSLDFIYGDAEKTINITSYKGTGELSVKVEDETIANAKLNETKNKITVNALKKGNTTLTITTAKTEQYLAKEIKVAINVTARKIDVTWSGDKFTYDGTEKEVTAKINNLVGNDIVNITYENNKKTNAGSYTARIVSLDNENYEIGTNSTHDWEIEQAEREVNISKNFAIIYGEPQDIKFTYTKDIEDVTPEVKTSDENILKVELIDGETIRLTGVSEGTTTFTLKIPASKNYKEKEVTCEVTVSVATGDIIIPDANKNLVFVYGDEAQEIIGQYAGNGNITSIVEDENVASVTIEKEDKNIKIKITPKNAGETKITISAEKTSQYNASEVEIQVTVKKRPVKLSWTENEFTYDGTQKEITASVENTVGKDVVNITTYKDNQKTNAGTYTAVAQELSNENYTTVSGENISQEWKIKRADINPRLEMEDYIYAGTKPDPKVYGNSGEADVVYYYYVNDISEKKNWSEVTSSTYLTAGTYYMYAEVKESSNYNGATTNTVSFNITVSSLDVTLTVNGETYDESWTNQTVRATIVIDEAVKNLTAVYYEYSGESGDMCKGTTENPVIIDFEDTMDKKVRFWGVDVKGKPLTGTSDWYEIKIDKIKPTIGNVETSNEKGNTKIITVSNIADNGGSGLKGYFVNDTDSTQNATCTEFAGNSFTYEALENKKYYFYVIDNAGNISDTSDNTQIEITQIVDKVSNINYDASVTVKVFETVKPSITYSGEPKEIIYEVIDENLAKVDNNGVITGENEGTTKLKVTFKNYDDTTEEIYIEINVERATPVINVATDVEFTYGDTKKQITYTYGATGRNDGDGTISLTYDENIIEASVDGLAKKITITPKNAGETTLALNATKTSKYESVSKTINVKVKPRIIEVEWGDDEFTYDGNFHEINANVKNKVSGDEVVLVYSGNKEKVVGNYIASIIKIENPNYTKEGAINLSKEWKIVRAERKIEVNPEELTLTYGTNGTITYTYEGETADVTIESDNTSVAKVKYTTSQNGGTITVEPQKKGECNIVITLGETDNYKEGTKKVKVTVHKNATAQIKIPNEIPEITYGDEPKKIPFEYDGDGKVEAKSESGDIISAYVSGDEIIVTPEGAGETKIIITAEETDKYEEVEKEIEIIVKPRIVELSWSGDVFTYDKKEKKTIAIVNNKVNGDIVEVSKYQTSVEDTSITNKATNAGEYTAIALELNNKNYTLQGANNTSHNWKIEKADRNLTLQDSMNIVFGKDYSLNFTYDGEDTTANVTIDKNVYMLIKEYKDGINSGEIIIEPKAAGETIVTVTIPETENYNAITKICKVTVMVSESGLVATNPEITLTYGDDEIKTTYEYIGNGEVTVESSSIDVVEASINEATKEITLTPKNAGEATITIKSEATEQYAKGEAKIKVIVKKRPVILKWSQDEFTFDNTQKEITATVENIVDKDVVTVTKYENNQKTDAGTYMAVAKELSNANYTTVSGENITHEWVIKKANRTLTMENSLTLEYGTNGKINYSYTGIEDTTANVTSEKTSIATVETEDGNLGGIVTVVPVAQGETKVFIVIPETKNYNLVSGECLVTIERNSKEKVNISESDKNIEFVYGDASKTISYTYNGNANIEVEVADGNIVSAELIQDKKIKITPKNAGNTKITITAPETEQYESSSVEINITVTKRIIEVTWSGDTFIYDGSEKVVTANITNKVIGDTVEITAYKTSNEDAAITNKATNAGKYKAIISEINNSNYALDTEENMSHEWKIEKASITPTISMNDYVYGGDKEDPTIEGNLGNGDVTYYVYSGDNLENKIDWKEVKTSISLTPGKYKMFAIVDETLNYKSGESNTVEFEITTVSIEVTLKENGENYDQKWTNNDVIAEIKVPLEATKVTAVYYKIDGTDILIPAKNWSKDETTSIHTITFNESFNKIIHFVGVDVAGRAITEPNGPYEIKIDKEKPVIGNVSVPSEKANTKFIEVSNITDEGGSGVKLYYVGTSKNLEDVTWNEFSGDNFKYEVFENNTYYIFVKDGAGNISEENANSQIEVSNIVDKISNAKLQDEIVVDVLESVIPKLEYSGEPKEIQYIIEKTDIATVVENTGVITGQTSGETILVVKIKDYDGTETELTAKVKVNARTPVITVNEPSEFVFTYGGSSKETTYEYDGDGKVNITSNDENVATVVVDGQKIIVTPHNAGQTTIKIETEETSKYKAGLKEISVTVKPKPIVAKWTSGDFVYDGTPKEVTAEVTNLEGEDKVVLTYKYNIKTNAGKYTAEIISIDDPNYTTEDGINIKYNWEIKKAKRDTQITSEITIDYGVSGEIIYSFSGEDTTASVHSAASSIASIVSHEKTTNGGKIIVIGEEAGICDIVVDIPETTNYDKATLKCKVTVNAAEPEFEVEDKNIVLTYGDEPFNTKYTYNGNSKIFTVSVSDDAVIKAALEGENIIITPVGVGNAEVTVKVGATGQYKEATAKINVIVNPLPIILEWGEDEFTYDGKEKEITATVKNIIGEDQIDLTYSGNKETVAGEYLAEVIDVSNKNYTVASGENITHEWKIKKAKREIEVQEEITLVYGSGETVEFRYTGEDVEAQVVNAKDDVAKIEYEDGTNKGTITITPVGVGETVVTITVPESKNYESATKIFIIKVSRAVPEITTKEKDIVITYGDSVKSIPYTYNGNGNVTATISGENIATVTVLDGKINIVSKKVGTATIVITSEETNQYTSTTTTINLRVKPRPIEVKWGATIFIYDGTEKEVTATVKNIVPGDIVTITGYNGNKATEKGTYTAEVTEVSNSNYTVEGGINLTTNWEIKELLPPDIIVKQGETIIESGNWASGDVEVTIKEKETTATDITFEYSLNGEDYIAYAGPFTISRETRETIIYARAYNPTNGEQMSLIGEYTLKLDKTDPNIRATSIETTSTVSGIIGKSAKVTVELTVEELISGMDEDELTADDIKVILMYKGIQTELTGIKKILVSNPANSTLSYGDYKYTLTLEGIDGNGSLYIKIPEKSVYDKATRYNQTVSINLGLKVDNEGPNVGIIKTSADSYGRVFEDNVELSVTATDESGILSYEWQYSKDGKTWETFKKDETSAELSEVIYEAKIEGMHYFRVIVSDIIGNKTTSQTAKVNVNMQMNRKPTIRFETTQESATKVKITAIIKSTRAIESIKVNASEFDKSEWKDKVVKTNNELTVTVDYMATSNGTYTWTVVDDLENIVSEKINITTIDDTRVIVSYKVHSATEYSRAKIEFQGNQLMKIKKVETPGGASVDISKGNECAGIIFTTTNFKKNVTANLSSFTSGTKFIFENKAGLETEVVVSEDISTSVTYIRVVEGLKKFNEIYGDSFSIKEAESLVKEMLSKTKGINGSVESYYGVENTSLSTLVTSQEQLMAIGYLSSSTSQTSRLKINQYGETEVINATIKSQDSNSYTTYMNGNATGVATYGVRMLNWTGDAIKNTFRITLRAK